MKSLLLTLITLFQVYSYSLCGQDSMIIHLSGILHPVTINKDRWGVSHIYASNEADLFFAQGYNAAKDRLFQFELFRRRATGTVAEILGQRELNRDIGTRLFKFRGDMNKEMKHYHPHGDLIIKSFVRGINTYIKQVLDQKEKLPLEFQWLGIKPGFWTPEVVISRHNGLLGNIQSELIIARSVSKIGTQRVMDIMNFHPHLPLLILDSLLTKEALNEDILKLYNAYRTPIQFERDDLLGAVNLKTGLNQLNLYNGYTNDRSYEGSNNWVINGKKSHSGFPMLANDPHRNITIPSLRYITHLQAPGWNVIGGGEPILPGISIGHNEYGAWGLTIFETDIEDLYVYKINPLNKKQYWHHGKWVTMRSIRDTMNVKGQTPHVVVYQYTIHGPVVFIDSVRQLAYAVRCAWLEPGCAPYLASLRMDQAKTWDEFRHACTYAYVPAENMVWADKKGNISWQTVGIAPIRNHHSGMVPVQDEIKNEWAGYLPILKRPSKFNPREGYLVTANENLIPANYQYMNSVGYSWADPFRGTRIREVLNKKDALNIDDFESLQTDYQSLPARRIIPMIAALNLKSSDLEVCQKALTTWNQYLNGESGMAGLYVWLERFLTEKLLQTDLPENFDDYKDNDVPITYLSDDWIIRYLDTASNRKDILLSVFKLATQKMQSLYGNQMNEWRYGDTAKFKHVFIPHTLSSIVRESIRQKINTPNVTRGGNGNTVGSTDDNDNQTSGASFRIIVDCADWDRTEAINTPGQSGDPESKYYRNLFDIWSKDQYFPLYYSKEKVNAVTDNIIVLYPVK